MRNWKKKQQNCKIKAGKDDLSWDFCYFKEIKYEKILVNCESEGSIDRKYIWPLQSFHQKRWLQDEIDSFESDESNLC